ncbi:MAG TPA: hypothetical protein DEF42_03590 [Desulfosporosinus sp.]|nr:hypothetical protein [Desulfosporosinus sp.]
MSKIPGFRSGKIWKKIIATVGYIFIALIAIGMIFGDEPKPTTLTTATALEKTPEQIAQEKDDAELKAKEAEAKEANEAKEKADAEAKLAKEKAAAQISDADKELLKKAYNTFNEQQLKQFAEIKEKYKKLSNAEVVDISADFARLSNEEATEEKRKAEAKAAEEKAAAEAKAIADAQADYKAWVDGQFSAWDGSNRHLVSLLKDNLNDPKSFDHVETVYWDKGDHLIIKMTYRAKNGFGGLVLQNVTGKSDYKTQTISIISQND